MSNSLPDIAWGIIQVKTGISSVSVEGALRNLEAEIPHWDFSKIRQNARKSWQGPVAEE